MKHTRMNFRVRNFSFSFLIVFVSLLALGAAILLGGDAASAQQKKYKKREAPLRRKAPDIPLARLYPDIMPVSKIRSGMRGYGLTVFQGTRIERFRVVIVGVLEKWTGDQPIIVASLESGYPVEHKTGVVGGMSGSPVYINGKVVGAVAWGFASFEKEPIFGITPIESMLGVWHAGSASGSSPSSRSVYSLSRPLKIGGKKIQRILVGNRWNSKFTLDEHTIAATPLQSLLVVNGFSSDGLKRLNDLLEPYNCTVLQGGGAGVSGVKNVPLVPGTPVGMQLLGGDFDISGMGTLTYRKGDRILAFGHPALFMGKSDLPLVTGYIHGIFPSYQRSFKLSSPVRTVGRIEEDRMWAISGRLGASPRLIPVTMSFSDPERRISKAYHLKVIPNKFLAGGLLAAAVNEAVQVNSRARGDYSARVSFDVDVAGYPPLHFQNVYFEEGTVGSAVSAEIGEVVTTILGNDFSPTSIKHLQLKVDLVPKRLSARISRVALLKPRYNPGDTVEVAVDLTPYGEAPQKRIVSIPLPEDLESGKLRISISGGAYLQALEKRVGTLRPAPVNTGQILNHFRRKKQNNQLVAKVLLPGKGLAIEGEEFYSLPPTVSDILESSLESTIKTRTNEFEVEVATPWLITGQESVTVTVERKGEAKKKKGEENRVQPPAPPSLPPVLPRPQSPHGNTYMDEDTEEYDDESAPQPQAPPTTPRPSATPSPRPDSKPKAPERGKWTQSSLSDFLKGEFEDVSFSKNGAIYLAPALRTLHETSELFLWCCIYEPVSGYIFAGSGNHGMVYKISRDGTIRTEFKIPDVEVFSLASDSKGNVYAGTGPHGLIYQITSRGEVNPYFRTGQKYVWSLSVDQRDRLYAGTGPSGALFEITGSGRGEDLFHLPQSHIRSLAFDSAGTLYAGTSNGGIIYRIPVGGAPEPVYDTPQVSVDALVLDKEGNLFAAASQKGAIYKITPKGKITYWDISQSRVQSLAVDDTGAVFAGTGKDGILYKLTPEDRLHIVHRFEETEILGLATDKEGAIYVASGNGGKVFGLLPEHVSKGSIESTVYDAGFPAEWGTIQWDVSLKSGTSVILETRSGNTETPDSSWSEWSLSYDKPQGMRVLSPPGRFIQYRAFLTTESSKQTPVLSSVRIFFKQENQRPLLALLAPLGGERLSKEAAVRWKALDPDGDGLVFDLYASSDEGQTWRVIKEGVLQKGGSGPSDQARLETAKEQSFTWGTGGFSDGRYILKVTASDRLHHAEGMYEVSDLSNPFLLDNTPPKVKITDDVSFVGKGDRARITGFVTDESSPIVNVRYRVDGGAWLPALPADGIFDTRTERFGLTTEPLKPGSHDLEVLGEDEAGNDSKEKITVKIQ
ncbi:MAG: hypothetical protein HYU64_06935 [Armatimonadetes bacterium]|nr:hypothetical protein [Armatimonadota bacterium]